ncbi:MAG: hypothetical protein D6698_02495 [Gammaproteobacteria bacterium]|nr:MAG: hypothetical protein D6698_02495 [Gammaproteobacteria bacterium]
MKNPKKLIAIFITDLLCVLGNIVVVLLLATLCRDIVDPNISIILFAVVFTTIMFWAFHEREK